MGIGYSKSDLQVPTAHNAHNRNHQICQKNMIQNEEKKALFNLPEKAISPHSINYKNRSPNIGYVITIVFDTL